LEVRLSYSAISSYERCPLSYRFQYIDRIEVAPSPYLSFGRSLHSALEWLYKRDIPEPPELEELLSHLDAVWVSEGYGDLEEERHFHAHAREILTVFYNSNIPKFRLPILVEERFELEMDGYLLTGVIDRVDCAEDGSIEIIDYKTNRRLPELSRLREDLQLPIYQMACREVWGISPAKLTFYYLVTNKRYTTRPYDAERLNSVRERLNQVASQIASGQFPPVPNRLCTWCSYEDICPARNPSGLLEEDYRARYRALLQRRERLDAVIEELVREMHELNIPLADHADGTD
jgi:RecB family exonuclease